MLIDLLVIAAYFGLILWIGLVAAEGGHRDRDLGEFALANRKMPWWAVLGSVIAAETSAGTFIGTPGEGFSLQNYTYLQLALGTILARVIIGFTFIKPFYRLKVFSIYEFLTSRFGTSTKNAASAVFLVTRVLASGTRIYVAAIILVLAAKSSLSLSGIPEIWVYASAVVFITVLTGIYTSFGGIKAVIWTDLIQATIMMGSALVAGGILLSRIPGGFGAFSAKWGTMSPRILDTGPSGLKGLLESEYTLWAGLLGSTFTTMATHGTDQDMVQRLLTAPNAKKSRLSLILSGLADLPIVFLFLTLGILLSLFYHANPDPTLPQKTNEVFCHFILHELPVGVRGLLIAGIFATAMGSLSTALNALATSFIRDWYLPFINPKASEKNQLRAARRATLGFSGLMILVGVATAAVVIHSPKSRILPIALGIFGYTYGSLLGVFLLGMLTKTRGNDRGNLIAMASGFTVVAFLSGLPNDIAKIFGTSVYTQPDWLPVIEFPWRVMAGTIVTFAVAFWFKTDSKHVRKTHGD